MSMSVRIEGLDRLRRRFADSPESTSRAVSAGLLAAAAVVQEDAKHRVHSDTNPWTGSTDRYYKRPTGKLKSSILIGQVEGSGIGKQIAVGVTQRGGRTFTRSSASGKARSNRGDVLVYGPIEEAKHPFLGPALSQNIGRIMAAFWSRFDAVFRKAA
jgi:hypothetical protein